MRNILLLLSVFLFSNCSDDIEDSNQTIQGEYNGLFFRSEASSAKIDENGYLNYRRVCQRNCNTTS